MSHHHRSPPPEPPEPPEPPSVYCTPSHSKASTPSHSKASTPSPSPHAHIIVPKQQSFIKPSPSTRQQSSSNKLIITPHTFENTTNKTNTRLLLRKHRHTNPAIWCSAIICLIFSLLLIFFGIATLIIFLVVKPKTPVLDASHATLNVIYFDSPEHFNGDFTFIANFSNPNKKLDVRFEYAVMELLFEDNLIASQSIRPFSQRRKETGVVVIRFLSSLVSLPRNNAMDLQRQVLSNKVLYSVRGTFKVRASFGAIHFSYWLHGRCELQMSSPPSGSLMAGTCKTKR